MEIASARPGSASISSRSATGLPTNSENGGRLLDGRDDRASALLRGADRDPAPAIHSRRSRRGHLRPRCRYRLDPAHAEHRRIANDLVELVCFEECHRQRDCHRRFGGGGNGFSKPDDGLGFGERFDCGRMLAPAPVEDANVLAKRQAQDANQMLRLVRRQGSAQSRPDRSRARRSGAPNLGLALEQLENLVDFFRHRGAQDQRVAVRHQHRVFDPDVQLLVRQLDNRLDRDDHTGLERFA